MAGKLIKLPVGRAIQRKPCRRADGSLGPKWQHLQKDQALDRALHALAESTIEDFKGKVRLFRRVFSAELRSPKPSGRRSSLGKPRGRRT